jgi:hypothetical protein
MLLLVTVICLGSALLLLPERDAASAEAVRVVPFAPAEITEVSVELPGGARQRLLRTEADRWSIELPSRDDTSPPVRWPASIDRVHGFLRIIDRLRAMPADESPADAPTRWVRVVGANDATISLGLPTTSLGGRAVVHVSEGSEGKPRPLLTSDELTRLLAGQALLNWLDARAFAGLDGRVTEVSISSAGNEMRLARAPGGWRVATPFDSPAEDALVEELLRNLQLLPFASPAAPAGPPRGKASDATVISLVSEVRRPGADGEVTGETFTHTLRTLAPTDAAGRIRAALESSAPTAPGATTAGPLEVEIEAARLTSVVRQPQFYLARRTLDAAPGDIHAFVIAYPSGKQTRWSRLDGSWRAGDDPASPADAAMLGELATLLTQTPAATAAWIGDEARSQTQILATIDCLGLGGASLGWVRLGVGRPPGAGEEVKVHAVITSAGVARYYPPTEQSDVVKWVHDSEPDE